MADDSEDIISTSSVINDPKGSIRRKYQTRLRRLAHTLDDFILHAEERLDAVNAGRIHKRTETEALLESCKILRAAIPVKSISEEDLPPDVYKNLCDIFGLDSDLPEDGSP